MTPEETPHAATPFHWPCLLTALAIMLGGTIYPPLLAVQGRADHGVATLIFFAMSAGFIRGVGFVPRHLVWRWLFSGWACAMALLLGLALKFTA